MNVHKRQWRRAAAWLAALLMAGGVGACTAGDQGQVSVLATWTGGEQEAFTTILNRFSKESGIKVNYTGSRAVSQVLATDVQTGSPPDIAVLSSVGDLAGYARRRVLQPLDQSGMDVPAAQGALWRHVESLGGTVRYAVTVKATLKSMIWYDHNPAPTVPQKWADLVTAGTAARWCLGFEATPASGWPGTDWIEDILLHTNPQAYEQLSAGKLSWNSDQVRAAWQYWGALLNTVAPTEPARDVALTTSFNDADNRLVTGKTTDGKQDPCGLDHEASFLADYAPSSHDIGFFPFPDAKKQNAADANRTWEVSVDLASMFRDTPQARKLIAYLGGDEAQQMWPTVSRTAFSTRTKVAPASYTTDVGRRIASILTSGATLCLDASDLMPPAMTDAFYQAVLAYVHAPDRLGVLLGQLDDVLKTVRDETIDVPCSSGK